MSQRNVDDEVDDLAALVAAGDLSEKRLEEMLADQDGDEVNVSAVGQEYDEDATDAALQETLELNAKLRDLENDLGSEMQVQSILSSHTSAARGSKQKKKVVVHRGSSRPGGAAERHKKDLEQQRIDRDNMHLLGKLQRIQSTNPGSSVHGHAQVRHKAASSINRLKSQREVQDQNLAFLKRLQAVKPTMQLGGASRSGAPVRSQRRTSRKPKKKPEWVDLSGGMYL
eukprot:m.299164 g.299164  ORF g.299164 m.299164 type:complete len:227 (-) comp20104_c1_seq7:412-1092(-)